MSTTVEAPRDESMEILIQIKETLTALVEVEEARLEARPVSAEGHAADRGGSSPAGPGLKSRASRVE